ncbi:SpoIID/LytB domain-containing protein [Candidatus Dependentiae bacterium]|nr:SpoIID/LytB domain-containing protein [Candidatus Dependentiae bacterium]
MLGRYRVFYLLVTTFFFITIKTFEVKVLLQKTSPLELQQNPITIKTPQGFIISTDPVLVIGDIDHQKKAEIAHDGSKVTINGKQVTAPFYLSPSLSEQQKVFLKKIVENWFITNRDDVYERSKQLQSFFDIFVEKKSVLAEKSYDVLKKHTKNVFIAFFMHHFDDCESSSFSISFQIFEQLIDIFLNPQRVKNMFLSHLVNKKLSKSDKKLLYENSAFRMEFFSQHVFIEIQELLEEFLMLLPRNLLTKMLKEHCGYFGLNDNNYLGVFSLEKDNHSLYLINSLAIDDYLLSVIHHEGWPGWPLEMNKVLAVTCRTYLVWQVLQAKKLNRIYHIEDNIRHQSYKGHHKNEALRQAVQETKDICIAYDNKPILAMFDACCGGIIPAYVDHQGYKNYPYLQRNAPCIYCRNCKIACWESIFSHDKLLSVMQNVFPNLEVIDDIQVTKKDKAELVKKVSIMSQGQSYYVTGKKMYSLFPEVKSFSFDIFANKAKKMLATKEISKKKTKKLSQKNENSEMKNVERSFVIAGKGYGHHMGLCQWGAVSLVRDYGWNYQKIIKFYYPGISFIKLNYQR